MSSSALKLLAASGAKGDPVYVDDVFSTFLYEGNASSQTITNGIDLSGEGGLTWFKARDDSTFHILFDTERGGTKWLNSASSNAEATASPAWVTYNSNGFTLPQAINGLNNTQEMVSWTFRKQPGFFDVVTYTGNAGSNRTISHNLGSVPGMIIIKKTSGADNWIVHHRSTGNNKILYLNTTSAELSAGYFENTDPTSTEFTVSSGGAVNDNGQTYVAYLFAHDAQEFGTDEDESIIKCGSYTGNGNDDGPTIDLGFEPQWLLIKSTGNNSGAWTMFDTMRGLPVNGLDAYFTANTSEAEANYEFLNVTSSGFKFTNTGYFVNDAGVDYIYMAIRRPNKPAEEFAATDLFNTVQGASSTANPGFNLGIAPDMAWQKAINGSSDGHYIASRMTGSKYVFTNSNASEATGSSINWDYMNGWIDYFSGMSAYNAWGFKRAPGFFDVVAYTGNGVAGRTVTHNLGVAPEMMWVKRRDGVGIWQVYTSSMGATDLIQLDVSGGSFSSGSYWNNTSPTSSSFTVGSAQTINVNTGKFLAYLFATVAGISKVGSYTGTGNDLNVDCGFSAGARFILIKRTDSGGDWYYWDSVRGIIAGNDPYLLLNETAAQVTNTDYIDPLASGFTVTSSAPAALNASGGSYIFYAIA